MAYLCFNLHFVPLTDIYCVTICDIYISVDGIDLFVLKLPFISFTGVN